MKLANHIFLHDFGAGAIDFLVFLHVLWTGSQQSTYFYMVSAQRVVEFQTFSGSSCGPPSLAPKLALNDSLGAFFVTVLGSLWGPSSARPRVRGSE